MGVLLEMLPSGSRAPVQVLCTFWVNVALLKSRCVPHDASLWASKFVIVLGLYRCLQFGLCSLAETAFSSARLSVGEVERMCWRFPLLKLVAEAAIVVMLWLAR